MKIKLGLLCLFILLTTYISTAQSRLTENVTEMDPEKSILINTENSNNYHTLLTAMQGSELEKILEYDGPFTVFAPSDAAFRKLPEAEINELLKPENKKQLQNVIAYHIVAGNLSASKILKEMCRGKGIATFTTVNGDEIMATMNGVDIVLKDSFGNSAKITTADANQCNGVIHEIDSVIMPRKS